jgi:hypothetical protein
VEWHCVMCGERVDPVILATNTSFLQLADQAVTAS